MASLAENQRGKLADHDLLERFGLSGLILLAGVLALAIPTMYFVISQTWTGEVGAHAPIVLSTGLWLLVTLWNEEKAHFRPASRFIPALLLALCLPLYLIARITQIVELEGYLMYACLLVVLYSLIGWSGISRLWFPLFYLAFIFPPPESVVAAVTVPMKLWLSHAAIWFLSLFGYPIGGEGVTIYVGQYELLVAAACSGLNTIISLSAISLFYVYMRHKADWRYSAFLALMIIPVALLANFFRVLILILLTYHAGEAAAQGFLHNFAGIMMFLMALFTMFALDELIKPVWDRLMARHKAVEPV